MILSGILSIALTATIQVCDVDGVATYTDRSDICGQAGEKVIFDEGTFSLVDGHQQPTSQEVQSSPNEMPQVIVVERIVERLVPVVVNVNPVQQQPARYVPFFLHHPRPGTRGGIGILPSHGPVQPPHRPLRAGDGRRKSFRPRSRNPRIDQRSR
jgi:hypothetical protein